MNTIWRFGTGISIESERRLCAQEAPRQPVEPPKAENKEKGRNEPEKGEKKEGNEKQDPNSARKKGIDDRTEAARKGVANLHDRTRNAVERNQALNKTIDGKTDGTEADANKKGENRNEKKNEPGRMTPEEQREAEQKMAPFLKRIHAIQDRANELAARSPVVKQALAPALKNLAVAYTVGAKTVDIIIPAQAQATLNQIAVRARLVGNVPMDVVPTSEGPHAVTRGGDAVADTYLALFERLLGMQTMPGQKAAEVKGSKTDQPRREGAGKGGPAERKPEGPNESPKAVNKGPG